MPEFELLEPPEGEKKDPYGQRVGLIAAIIGAVLAVVTIASHRSHTEAVVVRSAANDQWSLYQAKRIKMHTSELGSDLLKALKPDAPAELLKRYADEAASNDKESREVQTEARHLEAECDLAERKALRYDVGEGLLEVGLVFCSIYFISGKKLFPPVGAAAAVAGAVIAATGYFQHG
jgi:hypothetical protein